MLSGAKFSWLICGTMLAFAGVGDSLAQTIPAMPTTGNVQADLDLLIKSAKTEGDLLFYSAATENVAKRIAEAFTAKYGINAKFVRLGSSPLMQRFAAEAEAGGIAADLAFLGKL